MPPQRSRNTLEDPKVEPSSGREKLSNNVQPYTVPKNRRVAAATSVNGDPKESRPTNQTGIEQRFGAEDAPKIVWSSFDTAFLLAYKDLHHLDAPAAFTKPYNERMLTRPGIGRFSPTMARPKAQQRISKEQLAMAVRKDFNAAMVLESDTLTNFSYAAQNQDKTFRMRFDPSQPR